MAQVLIINQTHPGLKSVQANYCASFFSRLRGLMFRKALSTHEGILMVQPREDRLDASIHMFFMSFDIAVVWADTQLRVVDVKLARRWRPAYFPAAAARYVLETHPDRLSDFHIGDQLVVEKC
jgi:uncharacterized membrane protein (UPF0127 family)